MKRRLFGIIWTTAVGLMAAQSGGPKTFSSPEDARDALVQAAAVSLDAIRDLIGPGATEILTTGDPVQDKNILERFRRQMAEGTKLDPDEMNPNRIVLLVGSEDWPFAVPLLRKNGR